jgi:6-pyruvoyl-tetrahydropterin synthase
VVEATVSGPVKEGRVCSLPLLHEKFKEILVPLEGKVLNEQPLLDENTRKYPTCENLVLFLSEKLKIAIKAIDSDLILLNIAVSVFELSGEETGKATLRLS